MKKEHCFLLVLDSLSRAADTAELLLRKDYPAEAASLRKKVTAAKILVEVEKYDGQEAKV